MWPFEIGKEDKGDYTDIYYVDEEGNQQILKTIREFNLNHAPLKWDYNKEAEALSSAEYLRGVASGQVHPGRLEDIATLLESLQQSFLWHVKVDRVYKESNNEVTGTYREPQS